MAIFFIKFKNKLSHFFIYSIIVSPLKGGDILFTDLIISEMTGVIVYYICKWLNKPL